MKKPDRFEQMVLTTLRHQPVTKGNIAIWLNGPDCTQLLRRLYAQIRREIRRSGYVYVNDILTHLDRWKKQ